MFVALHLIDITRRYEIGQQSNYTLIEWRKLIFECKCKADLKDEIIVTYKDFGDV